MGRKMSHRERPEIFRDGPVPSSAAETMRAAKTALHELYPDHEITVFVVERVPSEGRAQRHFMYYTTASLSVREVAERMACFAGGTKETEYDNLIAAAPKLLAVARRWAALDAGSWHGSWHQERYASEKAELLSDTRAAIARAEGTAP